MIVRHISMKSAQKSNFFKLLEYLVNTKNKNERVGQIRVSNCLNSTPEWATHEILATQAKNKRAKGDKTYHLLISFANSESPSPAVLKTIEDKVIGSVGFESHQRISVVHHDTDNVHIHIAINKIHPQKLTMVEPFRAYKIFAEVASQLEVEFGLQQTNHKAKKVRSENLAEDMQHHAGVESLLGWVKRNCLEQLEQCENWTEFHKILAAHDLEIKLRGNGFVIANDKGLMVKASSVSRGFSKRNLEERFGLFESIRDTKNTTAPKIKYYDYQPLTKSQQSYELYTLYRKEISANKEILTDAIASARQRKNRLIEKAKAQARLKRAAVKLTPNRLNKKILYALISKSLLQELANIRAQYTKERDSLIARHKNHAFADWLQNKALDGNHEALLLMRFRKSHKILSYQLAGSPKTKASAVTPKVDGITKEGTAIYKVGECAIRDHGNELSISRGLSVQGLKVALEMACQKFGSSIAVSGSERFKMAILQVAVHYQLPLTFEDKTLEQQRQHFIKLKETINEQSRLIRGRTIRKSPTTFGNISRNRGGTRGELSPAHASGAKPNPECPGRKSPPQSNNRLRNLSELGMVQFTRRSEVFLPSNAHDKLECQRAKPNHHVRRSIFGLKLGNRRKRKDPVK